MDPARFMVLHIGNLISSVIDSTRRQKLVDIQSELASLIVVVQSQIDNAGISRDALEIETSKFWDIVSWAKDNSGILFQAEIDDLNLRLNNLQCGLHFFEV